MPAHPETKKDTEQVAGYADMLAAMGTEPRLRIMQLLLSAQNERVVKVRRDSTFLWYTAHAEALQELLGFLYAECCTRNKAVNPKAIIQLCA